MSCQRCIGCVRYMHCRTVDPVGVRHRGRFGWDSVRGKSTVATHDVRQVHDRAAVARIKDRREATARRQRLDEDSVAARWLSDRNETR
jgi:hypothetical protein